MKLLAHRGRIGTWPENAIASIDSALLMTSGVEVDVRLSYDGVPVLMHDADVRRTTDGRGRVESLTVSQLTWLRLGRNATVPRLADYLDAISGHPGVTVLLDLKDPQTACLDAVLRVLEGRARHLRVMVASRSDQALAELRARSASLSLGALGVTQESLDERLATAQQYGLDAVFLQHGDEGYLANRAAVATIVATGVAAGASRITRRSTIRRAAQDGCSLALVDLPAQEEPPSAVDDTGRAAREG